MSPPKWSVRLAVDETEGGPISLALQQALTPDVRRITITGPVGDYDEGADVVTFELEAQDARHARILAQHLLGEVRRSAALKREQARVVWVAPMLATARSSHRFLDHARELFESEDGYDLAVVAAQIHLEIQVKVLVEQALASDSSLLTGALIGQRHTWAPHDRWMKLILEALFGFRVKDYPRWKDYEVHLARRNDIAHRGQEVDQAAAQESIEVVEHFWLWLIDVVEKGGRVAGSPTT